VCCGCGSLAAVVRLQGAAGDQGPGTLFQRLGDQEFEFAGFIASKGKARLIVPLDQEPGSV
jgi:hypothetical protein